MIICSCNLISKAEIEENIIAILEDDPWALITPGVVYHAMSKRGKCCGCMPGVARIIVETVEGYHLQRQTPEGDKVRLLENLRMSHNHFETLRKKARTPGISFA